MEHPAFEKKPWLNGKDISLSIRQKHHNFACVKDKQIVFSFVEKKELCSNSERIRMFIKCSNYKQALIT